MTRMDRPGVWLLTCAAALAVANHAAADGVFLDSIGARAAGRGGADLGFADTGLILHDNPAGMARIDGDVLVDCSSTLLWTDLRYADPDGRDTSDHDPFPMGHLACIARAPDRPWSFGLGIFSPAGFGAEYHLPGPPQLPGPRLYKSFGSLARILPGAAYQVNDRLSVGATLGVAVSHVELEGPYFLQSPGPLQGAAMILDLQSTGAALSWSAGLQYQLTPQMTLGAVYQGENAFSMDGNALSIVPGMGRSRFDTRMKMSWPRSVGVGLRYQPCPHRTLACDVLWYDWSSAFDQLTVVLRDPENPAFANQTGQRLVERMPLRWRDSVMVRVGAERQLPWGHILRLGYVHHSNPIPDATFTPYVQTTLENTFSAGYGWTIQNWEADVAYQYGMGPRNSVATSDLVGGDFSGSTNRGDVHVVYWSWIRRW